MTNRKLLTMYFAAALPLAVYAGGSHDDDHHHHGATEDDHHHSNPDGHAHGPGSHASAVGGPGDATAVNRIVRVDLLDSMRFAFDKPLDLQRGDVVRFVVTNRGQIRHEFSIGNEKEQSAHRAMMRKMPDMVHEDPNTVTVEPGGSKELVWRFDGEDPVVFACNIPGHAEAGMVATTMLRN